MSLGIVDDVYAAHSRSLLQHCTRKNRYLVIGQRYTNAVGFETVSMYCKSVGPYTENSQLLVKGSAPVLF
jgi:hypothetical protein